MSEAGPLLLMAAFVGSALGARFPSRQGRRKHSLLVILATTVAAFGWVFAAALAWWPTHIAEGHARRADAWVRAADLPPRGRDLLTEASQAYLRAASAQPLNADYAFQSARALMFAGVVHADRVEERLRLAIARNGFAAEYHAARAANELTREHPDRRTVTDGYTAALGLNPADVRLRLDYARALEQRLRDPQAAAEQYRTALDYDAMLPQDEPKRLSASDRARIEADLRRLGR